MSKISKSIQQKQQQLSDINIQLQHISTYLPETKQNQKIITAYSPKLKTPITFPEQGRTKQSFKDECNINLIMAKFQKTGILEFTNNNQPQYGDVSTLDYQEAMQTVAAAQTMFEELPSSLRKRFENEPAKFLEFVGNDKNRAEALEMGLLNPQATTPLATPSERQEGTIPAKPEGVSGEVSSPDAAKQ